MKSGSKHLPLGNIKLKGKIIGPEWSCGCCGYAFNLKKYFLNKRDKNAKIASTELKCTRGNITNAIRFKRQIGKRSKIKLWVCYKDSYDEFTKISKNFSPSD